MWELKDNIVGVLFLKLRSTIRSISSRFDMFCLTFCDIFDGLCDCSERAFVTTPRLADKGARALDWSLEGKLVRSCSLAVNLNLSLFSLD